MLKTIFSHNSNNAQRGLLIIKLSMGALFLILGIKKFMAGQATWISLGSAMSIIGITFFPAFWGLCAVLSELGGGLSLITGRYIKYTLPFTMITMLVATLMHLHKGDGFSAISYPLILLMVLAGIYCAE